jgi:stage II sporulation protein D
MRSKVLRWLALSMLCVGGSLHAGAIENMLGSWWKAEKRPSPTIAVLIVHDKPGVVLEVKGKYKLYDPHTNAFVSTRFIGKRKFMQALTDGLKWGEEFPGIYQIKIVPDEAKTTTLVDGVEYQGDIYVYDIGGTVSVVNYIPVDEYLNSISMPKIEKKLPDELNAAIAIAARTNAWYQAQNAQSKYWAVDAAKVGYGGRAAAPANGLTEAIYKTKNMIMIKDGTPFAVEWPAHQDGSNSLPAQISLAEAETLADHGDHAAEILNQVFPGVSLSLIDQVE